MGKMTGGQSYTELFPITSDHATVTTTAAITMDNQVTSQITKDGLVLDTIKCDPETIEFLEDNASEAEGSDDAESVLNEKGTTHKTSEAAGSGAQQFLAITYGAVTNNGTDDVVEVIAQIGTLSEDAGDRTLERNKFHRPKFQLNVIKTLQDVTIPNAILQTASPALVVAPGTPFELPSGRKRKTFFPVAGADA